MTAGPSAQANLEAASARGLPGLDGVPPALVQRVQLHRHDSELGRWIEARCLPHPALAEHVELIFYGEGEVTYRRDRILPRGLPHLLINLGPPQYLVRPGGDGRRAFTDLWFAGQQETFLETETPQGSALIGVVFRPYGAYPALATDQDALAGEVVGLTALLGDRVRRLQERLLDTGDLFQRFAIVEGWLLERISRGRPVHPATRWAAERIARSEGQVRVRELAAESGYSRKHLAGLFRREVGLTAKSLARIQRFHAALARLRRSAQPGWSRIAADCGYYDQSHLIRDVRLFAGCTPVELAATPAPDDVTLALG